MNDQEIESCLAEDGPAESTCNRLVQLANEAGGSDNITVVLARHREAGAPAEQAEAVAEAETLSAHRQRLLADTETHLATAAPAK